ncbi:MAG: Flp pilus assembly complex ATPase component TadA [Candidatus Omnitrophica bacterium]|nr:Flp pilus assembly complex ATPase component TadA [Candidatus Omnitrophota bacterium]
MGSLTARLSSALVAKGLVTKEQIAELLEQAGEEEKSFVKLLLTHDFTSEEQLLGVLSAELGIPTISLHNYEIDPAVARLIPERVARQYTLIPISKLADRLVVAMADATNIIAIDDLKTLTQHAIDPVLAPETEIRHAIEQCYGDSQGMPATIAGEEAPDVQAESANLESIVQQLLTEDAGEAPVVRAINLVILEALRKRASDIHLEPMEHCVRVRYRIDGHLVEGHRLPKATQSTVLTRLKIMSGLDITEWRLPQDGRFKVRLGAQEVDFRVSVLPIVHGGKIVMRALNKSDLSIGLDNLGFLPESIAAFKEAVKRPFGMILVTGPTGSGKSTTLYSILNQLNTVTRNIITVEDPVEYQLPGVTQVPVNPDIGLTFARGLRSILRQNPDVVMVGEIRDFETADIAMKASLTGHLVLSTLHTNDAPSAVTRLVDMGVEPFLVASSVTLIEAQRLVRKLCQKCREPYDPPKDVLERLGLARIQAALTQGGTNPVFYRSRGCHICHQSGYRGRMGIIEVVLLDEHIRELIATKAQSWEIKNYAVEKLGMTTLREDGLKKAAIGLTALEEVLQATTEE